MPSARRVVIIIGEGVNFGQRIGGSGIRFYIKQDSGVLR